MLIRPRHLSPGDTLGIIAPASAPPDPKATNRAVAVLEKLGFKIKLAPNVHQRHGYLAGSDRDRAGDLMRMFADRKVNAILCVRGGYGTARLLPLLDYRVIRDNAKIFVGYSDITSLHCAFLTKANLISFHGPMLNSDFVHADMPDFTLQSFLRTLSPHPFPTHEPLLSRPAATLSSPSEGEERAGRGVVGFTGANRGPSWLIESLPVSRGEGVRRTGEGSTVSISDGYRKKTVKILRRGLAHGQLIGGNLALLCTTIGTPWQPPFQGRLLFLEDVGEQPYRFDRMLTYLLNCGLLQQVAGLAVGINADCDDPRAKGKKEYRQTLNDVLKERLLPLKVPIVAGLPFGHVPHNATLPVGVHATLDAQRGDLLLTEPAVS